MLDDVKFCKKCGEKLFFTMYFSKHCERSGRKMFKVLGVCPQKEFYNAHTRAWVKNLSGNRIEYSEDNKGYFEIG